MDFVLDNWSVFTSIGAVVIALITDHSKIKNLKERINDLETDSRNINNTLDKLSNLMTEITVKMNLLLDGRIKTDD